MRAIAGTLEELADGVVVYTAGGDPNVGAVIGRDGIAAIDARATPAAARPWLTELRGLSDKPIRYLVLTHYHAVRVLGAAAFDAEEIVASEATSELISTRGAQDWESEFRRFPRLAPEPEGVAGLTIPTLTFERRMSLDLGDREVVLEFAGPGHTAGDSVVWLPQERILFAGDLVERAATPYTGEGLIRSWMTTTMDRVAAYEAQTLIPGRGPAVRGDEVGDAIAQTRGFLSRLWQEVAMAREAGLSRADACRQVRDRLARRYGEWAIFEHCIPYNVARALEEMRGEEPYIWTAEADRRLAEELGARA
jgi:glyoxylase-like metal-dependent hydrolase (beta-lactamase superfamily II)